MKNLLSLTAVTATVLAASLFVAPASFAKGHNQGFGAGTAGPATAGQVDDAQSNRDGNGSETSYGRTDASVEAKDGTQGNSEAAQDRSDSGHPSNRE